MKRRTWGCLGLALGVVALVIAWQAWEEWRVRRRLDEALAMLQPFVDGPVETWLARLPPPKPPNASLRHLEWVAHWSLVDLTDAHVRGAALQSAYGNGWKTELRSYLAREMARTVVDGPRPPLAPPTWLDPERYSIIGLNVLPAPLPEWPAQRELSMPSRSPLPWMWLSELVLAGALTQQNAGEAQYASAIADGAWRLVEVLRHREDMDAQLLAINEAGLCAGVVRHLEQPEPVDWRARLQVEPFRLALLHATLVECFEWHAAARARELPPPWPAPTPVGGLFAKLPHSSNSRADRLAVADAIEATVPFLRALDDPARCGSMTIPRAPMQIPGQGVAALGGDTTFIFPLLLERLDRLRVQFELTRRVLELREQRAKDPAGRWPVTLGEEASECPGVRFLMTEPTPGIVVIEAVGPPGDPWLTRHPAVFRPPLRVELTQPPP